MSAEPAPAPRGSAVVRADIAAMAADGRTRGLGGLLDELFELGKAEARAEGRKSLGLAWSAFLEMVPAEFWRFFPYDDPGLYGRLRRALLKGEAGD